MPWQRASHHARTPVTQQAAQAGAVVLAVVVVWAYSIPFRADLSASDPRALETAMRHGRLEDRSTELAGWEPEYWLRLVYPLAEQGELQAAAGLADRAVEAAPLGLSAVLTPARLEVANEDAEEARERYVQALRIEPQHPEVALEAARFARAIEDEPWVRQLVVQVLAADPGSEDARSLIDAFDRGAES